MGAATDYSLSVPLASSVAEAGGQINDASTINTNKFPYVGTIDPRDSSRSPLARDDSFSAGNTWSTLTTGTAYDTGGVGFLGWAGSLLNAARAIKTAVQGTLTVSAASLPLPTGAALDATLTSGAQKAQGNVASGTADSGNPLKVGGVFNTAAPTLSTGQRGDVQLDSSGNLKVAIAAGGGSGGTASTVGSAYPTTATAIGVKSGATMVAVVEGQAPMATSLPVALASDQSALATNPRALEAQYDWTTSAVALGILNAPQGLAVTVNSGSGTSRTYAVVAVCENGDSVPCATVAASGGVTANDTLSWQESPGAIGYRILVNGNVVTAQAPSTGTPLAAGTLAYTYTSGATSAYTAATAGPRVPLPVRQEPTTATPGVTRLAASVTSATNSTALAGARKWSLYNESSNGTLYILKASGTASATNYSDLPIAPGGYLTEETAPYQGPLSYVWVGAVGGSAVLTVGV